MSQFLTKSVQVPAGMGVGFPQDFEEVKVTRVYVAISESEDNSVKALANAYGPEIADGSGRMRKHEWADFGTYYFEPAEELLKLVNRLQRNVGSIKIDAVTAIFTENSLTSIRVVAAEDGKVRVISVDLDDDDELDTVELAYEVQSLF